VDTLLLDTDIKDKKGSGMMIYGYIVKMIHNNILHAVFVTLPFVVTNASIDLVHSSPTIFLYYS
jgi:hypothetical protein